MICKNCDGQGWVCENHSGKPWSGLSDRDDACHCGAGAPCPVCNWEAATSGVKYISQVEGFKRAVDLMTNGQSLETLQKICVKIERSCGPLPDENGR